MLNNTEINTRICLIEDIFKMGTLLSVYLEEFRDWLQPSSFMFDTLYDKTIEELDSVAFNMQIELNSIITKRAMLGHY